MGFQSGEHFLSVRGGKLVFENQMIPEPFFGMCKILPITSILKDRSGAVLTGTTKHSFLDVPIDVFH